MDSLGLQTTEDKLQAISRLSFPTTLVKLETYLGITGQLRDYIIYYVAITKPLQNRKILILTYLPRARNKRKNFATRVEITILLDSELKFFYTIQVVLSKPSFLIYFDDKLTLYVDLDASKDFGFRAIVYYIFSNNPGKNGYPQKSQIRPILFLSYLFKDIETRYQSIELELIEIIQVLTKTRYIVELVLYIVVYIDYGAILEISKQTSIITSSTTKLNLRLIRASEYIQRFRSIKFRYKLGKQYIIPDTLSQLSQTSSQAKSQEEGQLDLCYHITLMEMSDSFKSRLATEYVKDPQWNRILGVLKSVSSEDVATVAAPAATPVANAATESESRMLAVMVPSRITGSSSSQEARKRTPATRSSSTIIRSDVDASKLSPASKEAQDVTASQETQEAPDTAEAPVGSQENRERQSGLRFKLRNGLIYYTNHQDRKERLCVPNILEKEIFKLGYDRQYYRGFYRIYDRITGSLYLRNLIKYLRNYIKYYPEYKLNQISRYKLYSSLILINRSSILFHIIAIDFIISLPIIATGQDSLLTVIDKFSKRVLLLLGKTTFTATEQADILLANLTEQGQGILVATISNRDFKFISELWQAIFKKLGTNLLVSTAYYPQTDSQSERTN